MLAAPLAVATGLNEPQAPVPVLPQVTDQFTPLFAESLVTTAVSEAVAPTIKEAGGVPLNATETGPTGVVLLLEHATSAAIMLVDMNRRMPWRSVIRYFP